MENSSREGEEIKMDLVQGGRLKSFSNFVALNLFLLALVGIKIPSAFRNFWAEDGGFYEQALVDTFPEEFFSSGGGYLIFISRIISRIVTLGPIEHAPFVNAVVVNVFLSLFIQRVYVNLGIFVKSRIYKAIISISLFLLPINNFDVIASGGALHFQLLFVSLILALSAKERKAIYKLDTFIIAVAILSDPFTLITLMPLFFQRKNELAKIWRKVPGSLTFIIASVITQIAMVINFQLQGNRSIGTSPSILKTLYLFLDRVIGSTFVPHWGHISSSSLNEGGITRYLVMRAVIGLVCTSIILIFISLHLQKRLPKGEIHTKSSISWLVFLSSFYWLTVGLIFNPEPRYAIFPGLCFLLTVLILIDHRSCQGKGQRIVCVPTCIVLSFSILIWILSATPNERRILGPEWGSQISIGKSACAQSGRQSVWIKTLPTDDGWKVEIPCQSLAMQLNISR
jgi:hypothetical protein